ncbi:MAG: DUF192 domain-containing protein [Sulfuritalea sp.]|nr:DUF192 domain-containing protein [Sulfuritalea sp.]
MTLMARVGIAQQNQLPLVELVAGVHRIQAEVAATPDSRQIGLMQRRTMALQHGMLFVFSEPGNQCMWMRNTLIPLSVAFLDERGRIINIEDMQPKTENTHCAVRSASYALEMNLGWFKKRGLGAGFAIQGIDKVPTSR